jgi:hypothetical protein
MGKMAPMNDALAGHCGERPRQHPVDGGFLKLDDIETLARNRGLTQFLVRSVEKVKATARWHAPTHDMVCSWRLIEAQA